MFRMIKLSFFKNLILYKTVNVIIWQMAAGTIRCDKLPISADKLQIAFDASMNSVHNNCQFSLNQLKYFNLPDAIFVDLSKIKEDNPKWSFLGIVGYGVNLLSNVDSFRYYMYTKIMDALENVVHDEVGKINWEKYTNYFVPNVRMLFEKDFWLLISYYVFCYFIYYFECYSLLLNKSQKQ